MKTNELELHVSTWKTLECNLEQPCGHKAFIEAQIYVLQVGWVLEQGKEWPPGWMWVTHKTHLLSIHQGSKAQISMTRNVLLWVRALCCVGDRRDPMVSTSTVLCWATTGHTPNPFSLKRSWKETKAGSRTKSGAHQYLRIGQRERWEAAAEKHEEMPTELQEF